jgi:E3 ubiquitin-protein ligase EDD1
MLLTGHKPSPSPSAPLYEDRAFLVSQSGTALLDKFTHCLMVKCSVDMLDVLLGTLIRQLQLPSLAERQDAKMVAKRSVEGIHSRMAQFKMERKYKLSIMLNLKKTHSISCSDGGNVLLFYKLIKVKYEK